MDRHRILLVEDSSDDVELTTRALLQSGITAEIEVARDGVEAIDRLFGKGADQPPPDLVLLDLKLPKVDGLEVLRAIRAHERTRFVPVIILTSSDEDRDMTSGYRLGANSYVRKPVDYLEFARSVERLGAYWLLVNCPVAAKG